MKVIHIEPTDVCNAACPQCLRSFDPTFDSTVHNHLTVKQIVDMQLNISALDKMFMCGDYGDPAAGKHTIEIYEYFRSQNPNITLGMNTNGGLRGKSFWQQLAKLTSNKSDYVIFSIDGLEDTNHIYRRNVNWHTVMQNVNTYIKAGGRAHWDMLVFEHNEHQVDDCQQLAQDMGFDWFRAKVSKRHEEMPVDFLHPPKGWKDPVVKHGDIRCQALEDQSIYINARGELYPCCYLGPTAYTLDRFAEVQQSWHNKSIQTCVHTCSANEVGTSFTNQWQREIEFK